MSEIESINFEMLAMNRSLRRSARVWRWLAFLLTTALIGTNFHEILNLIHK